MVGKAKALVKSIYGEKLNIRGNYKSVDKVVLGGGAFRIIRLIIQPAGRHGVIVNKAPTVG